MALGHMERILILAKTYPSPSAQYVETSCVAGISEDGSMRRLYPVPFRMVEEDQQFRKWQWINVRVDKANKDHRPESHKVFVDTIVCRDVIEPNKGWIARRPWLDKIPAFEDFDAIEAARLTEGTTIALLRPKEVLGLEIKKARHSDWTEDEREKLLREQMQGDLFSEAEARRQVKELQKIPFDFYYHYLCDSHDGEKKYRHKIVDWEAGQLYRNCRRSHGNGWEAPFRAKLEDSMAGKDLMFLMGNQHRFPTQWLIISLIYPPKPTTTDIRQGLLF